MVRRAVEKNRGGGKGKQSTERQGGLPPAEHTGHGGHSDSTGRAALNKAERREADRREKLD